ncbi:hypothetical protein EW026_g1596 [Hermanssonia centrifuga]|uniref:HMG box domain-containing protein n=1 Tax=Hermanssonia centrifuga TaxID=98765 RepID=A0A4S4KQX0_9APHY|nr:hypothetical protein EW026_g1596 [Hermanssonia centrifuga]
MLATLVYRGFHTSTSTGVGLLRSHAPSFASKVVTRTFLTTPRIAYPTNTTSEKAAASPAAKKPAAKKPVAKKPAAKKQSAAKSERVVLSEEDMPPKQPLTAYFIFLDKFRAGKLPSSLETAREATREAAAAWHALSDQERKVNRPLPFIDEYDALWAEYRKRRQTYLDTVSPATLAEVNRRRMKAGKRLVIVRRKKQSSRPLSAFFAFLRDFRADFNPSYSGTGTVQVESARAAGAKWRALSDAERAPYMERAAEEMAAAMRNKSP